MTAPFHDLQGKSVFITRGGSGIGAALTDGFLAQGANVACVGRSDASALVQQVARKHVTPPLFSLGDISDTARVTETVAEVATNGGITALCRAPAREFGPDDIRDNVLAPGWVLTENQLGKGATPDVLPAYLATRDIVEAVLFLASDCCRMMTVQCMAIGGGVVATG